MRAQKGFTLVELMIVITMVGVLAAVAQPKVSAAISKARASEFPAILHRIRVAQDISYTVNTNYGTQVMKSSDGTMQSELGIDPKSTFFTYTVIPVDFAHVLDAKDPSKYGQAYMVGCKVVKGIGGWSTDGVVLFYNSGLKYANPAEPVYKYAAGWVSGSDLSTYDN